MSPRTAEPLHARRAVMESGTAARSGHGRAAAFTRAGLLAAAVVGLDQLTKRTVAAGIAPGKQESLFPGVHLVHVHNTGVAFGFLSGGGTIVLACTLVALVVLIAYFVVHPGRRGLWVPTGLLLGGAVGNLIDRLMHGSVTDFIKLPHWPAFNVADMAITFGVIALLFVLERGHGR
ncbi:MAG: signal peptidase II [Solirubrobacterales bacterium]|nr:signal peptidase II [Solirubrobacterales bacterium]MBV8940411.1 signal peptidase II [Solirubrobacterales bacterium]MBV9167890.1 signal peptidase II [Solirubrobacterales bacterium]